MSSLKDKFEEMIFEGHPLGTNILGTTASVKRITRDELIRFVRDKFTADRMAFSIVADIDEKKMERQVLKMAGEFFPDTLPQDRTDSGENSAGIPKTEPFEKTLNKRNHQANCIIGGLAPSLYQERERLATILLCNILGGPATNSILNSVLREKHGWVYGVECSYTQFADTGLVAISLGCDKSNLDKCIKAVGAEIAKLQAEPLSERKLKAAKKQLLGQLAVSSDNGETQCLSMGKSLLAYGKITEGKETKALIDGIKAEDVQEMARTIFNPSRISKLIYV